MDWFVSITLVFFSLFTSATGVKMQMHDDVECSMVSSGSGAESIKFTALEKNCSCVTVDTEASGIVFVKQCRKSDCDAKPSIIEQEACLLQDCVTCTPRGTAMISNISVNDFEDVELTRCMTLTWFDSGTCQNGCEMYEKQTGDQTEAVEVLGCGKSISHNGGNLAEQSGKLISQDGGSTSDGCIIGNSVMVDAFLTSLVGLSAIC
eukprot:gnl/MRDRNA2_/MRDRNA2_282040_c0_seq1.p1 gnl/MRDRNA2_/MRDRNA2_282040_c0~~gnl/MRDRNA2_/MRDRNA2_282040_c0_seq1.p1  ORF type:complete len:206 (+),score=40.84 gnl/MRDRNA2_/MRDRNA2_282040_c0_seq1:91-708(+)